MPTEITLHAAGVWFVVGLITGAGWAIAAAIIQRLTK